MQVRDQSVDREGAPDFVSDLSSYAFSSLRDGDFKLHRGSGPGVAPILLVTAENASRGSLRRLEHEYALRADLDAAWAARPIELFLHRNRSALVRVPLYHPGKEQATRMELRCPDPACNPYLTFAVLLQAGLEGIEKGYELPEPMEKNLYHLAPDDRRRLGIEQLPETLGEAIALTAESELVLRTLGEHMFNRYIEIKRQEWDDYRVQVTPWELERYLPVL